MDQHHDDHDEHDGHHGETEIGLELFALLLLLGLLLFLVLRNQVMVKAGLKNKVVGTV